MTDTNTIIDYILKIQERNNIDFGDLDYTLTYDMPKNGQLTGDFPGFFEFEAQKGGEGQGSEYYVVFSYQADEDSEKEYFRFDGYYDSWNGTEYDDAEIKRVQPKEVTIIEWEVI